MAALKITGCAMLACAALTLTGCANSPARNAISPGKTFTQADAELLSLSELGTYCKAGETTFITRANHKFKCTPEAKQLMVDAAARHQAAQADMAKREADALSKERMKNMSQRRTVIEWGKKHCDLSNRLGQTVASVAESQARKQYRGEHVSWGGEPDLLVNAFNNNAPVTLTNGIDKNNIYWGMIYACATPDTVKALQAKK